MGLRKEDYSRQAAEWWENGRPLDAGKLIYDNLPLNDRPKWAASILKLVLDRAGIQSPQFSQVLALADHENMWSMGHRVFDALRQETLGLDRLRRDGKLTKDEALLSSIVSLAELVAKVTYNATNPPDEFDEDSGCYLVACLRGFVDYRWSEKEFAILAWLTICSFR